MHSFKVSDISIGLGFVGCDYESKMCTDHGNAGIALLAYSGLYMAHPTVSSAMDVVISH